MADNQAETASPGELPPDVSEAFSSNSVRLSAAQWAIAAAAIVAILLLVPWLMQRVEPLKAGPDYRHPYAYGEDYWLYARWGRYAASQYPVEVVGDSVVWGHYVEPSGTLSHFLNQEAGRPLFANLGLDGTRPMALVGLLEYYGKDIADRAVILHLNPLWMSSDETDLQTRGGGPSFAVRALACLRGFLGEEPPAEEQRPRINHPGLLAQVHSRPYGYRPSLAEVVGTGLARHVPYAAWVRHVRMVYFQNLGVQSWTLENPYRSPLAAVTLRLPQPEDRPEGNPVPWFEAGVECQDFPWVPVDQSYQWERFRRVLRILQGRGNDVFVLLGPLNTHLMTEASARRYAGIRGEMEAWLTAQGVPFCAPPALPSGLYADASHPLEAGYAQVARALLANDSFREWLARVTSGVPPARPAEPSPSQAKENTDER